MFVEMMQERGLNLTHTTIMRWVHQYSPIIDERVRKHIKRKNNLLPTLLQGGYYFTLTRFVYEAFSFSRYTEK